MGAKLRGLGLVIALLALTAGCRSTGVRVDIQPGDPTLDGKFWVSAGEGDSVRDLYELRLEPSLRLYRRTTTQRVFGIDACPERLVVTVADETVNFADTLRVFDSGELSRVPGMTEGRGSIPTVRPDCQVAYTRYDTTVTPTVDRVYKVDGTIGAREVHAEPKTAKALGGMDWGPDGSLAIAEARPHTAEGPGQVTGIVIIAPDGSKRTVPVPAGATYTGVIQWDQSPFMALAQEDRTVFFNPDTGETAELAGWVPLAWAPDGQRLLVADAERRMTVGLVDRADLSKVRTLGSTKKVAFYDAVWLNGFDGAGGPRVFQRDPDDGEVDER